ncbi:MAG: VacJ family lipoprotein [Gammaproteobacteria bacterium]|nr:MAG: VacJ family lipoprotein [Gammaproteobacteria bacterium]
MKEIKIIINFSLILILNSCASSPDDPDPWEGMNRGIYSFNEGFDEYVAHPIAGTYKEYAPGFVRAGVYNFFSNLDDFIVFINGYLQFKAVQGTSDLGRFVVNSTIGIFGLFDVATYMGLVKHNEDFGQTMGYWGVGDGPYFVIPFIGPSSVRDTAGWVADYQIDLIQEVEDRNARYGLVALKYIHMKSIYLDANEIARQISLDKYSFIRDAYLQRRQSLVADGNVENKKEEELDEDLDDL